VSHSDTRCARLAGPATTPPVLIPAAQHSVEEVPAVTPRPTAEVSSTRRSAPVLPALPENPGQEAPVRGLAPAPAPAPGLASELAPAPEHPALCVTRTLVGERRTVMKVWTVLVTRDQSVPVREDTEATPWWPAGEESVSMIASVLQTEHVSTTSAKIPARDPTPPVVPTLTARW